MICGISINDVAKQNSITAPLSALQRSGDKFFLFIAENSNGMVARKRMLETGLTNDTQIEVFGGLSVNDQIITNGYLDVSDGQKISIQNAK
jgi:multidrug efflux pump subunit AcrA (membrane-fusion protein)